MLWIRTSQLREKAIKSKIFNSDCFKKENNKLRSTRQTIFSLKEGLKNISKESLAIANSRSQWPRPKTLSTSWETQSKWTSTAPTRSIVSLSIIPQTARASLTMGEPKARLLTEWLLSIRWRTPPISRKASWFLLKAALCKELNPWLMNYRHNRKSLKKMLMSTFPRGLSQLVASVTMNN